MPTPTVLSRRSTALALAALTACAPAASVPPSSSPSSTTAAPEQTTLLVRLGADTVGVEQYIRTGSRLDGTLLSRSPITTLSRYTVELGPDNAPTSAEYSLRRGDGTMVQGAMQSLSVRYWPDSVSLVGHRTNGDTVRTNPVRGLILPYINGAYGMFELALARLQSMGRDSATFSVVPLNFGVRNSTPMAVRKFRRDSVRINWFGSPLYARHDGRGRLLGLDGRQTTVKVQVDRVAPIDLDALGKSWTAREQVVGMAGPASTRDTARATLGSANLWVDYGRPALRGRDVWTNGVLGDSIWRTGANAATQLHSDVDLLIGGQVVPAGTYSLWTQANRDGYHLVVNKQAGQWGTEYHADRDLIRVPLRESSTAAPVERFTVTVEPGPGQSATLELAWGTKVLSVPISVR
ncbi:MAG: hypothetical protein JWN53_2204 [Gemmatimonadetes bacterium]|nr:hypothetical protein [Gemmatimonadota bacterium]